MLLSKTPTKSCGTFVEVHHYELGTINLYLEILSNYRKTGRESNYERNINKRRQPFPKYFFSCDCIAKCVESCEDI